MTDDARPRPQYGEYATPEEQRARIRQPDATFALDAGQSPDLVSPPAAPLPPAAAAPAAATPARGRLGDRIVTFALLGYGLITVIQSLPAMVDPAGTAAQMLSVLGRDGTLSDPAGARAWGIAAAVVYALGWFVTAGLSLMNVRAGRLSFWIPLTGGVVFTLLTSLLIVVPMMSDPAFVQQLTGLVIPTPAPTPS